MGLDLMRNRSGGIVPESGSLCWAPLFEMLWVRLRFAEELIRLYAERDSHLIWIKAAGYFNSRVTYIDVRSQKAGSGSVMNSWGGLFPGAWR